jgi:phage portal protein BeeE
MIGDTTKAKGWSTLEQQNQDLLNYTFNPYMQNVEQGINRSLIPANDWGAVVPEYDTNIFLKSDIAGRTAYYTAMYNVKAMNPNEIRHAEGLNSRDGGDEYAVVNAPSVAIPNTSKKEDKNANE